MLKLWLISFSAFEAVLLLMRAWAVADETHGFTYLDLSYSGIVEYHAHSFIFSTFLKTAWPGSPDWFFLASFFTCFVFNLGCTAAGEYLEPAWEVHSNYWLVSEVMAISVVGLLFLLCILVRECDIALRHSRAAGSDRTDSLNWVSRHVLKRSVCSLCEEERFSIASGPCGHESCIGCLEKWFVSSGGSCYQGSCPFCRSNLSMMDLRFKSTGKAVFG